jgi:(2R)-sulfolactate sulfo-lyase subunit alpha
MRPQFLFHDKKDNVGVAVVEIKAGEKITGSCLEDGKQITLDAKEAIPLGHKVAIAAVKQGDSVIKYGVVIGRAEKQITAGQHVHVHNIKSNRWQHGKV